MAKRTKDLKERKDYRASKRKRSKLKQRMERS